MTTEALERAIASTRRVLTHVTPDQLEGPTPCASWKVRELVNHIVGGANWFATCTDQGTAPEVDDTEDTDYAATDFVAAFDEATKRAVASFNVPGATEKTIQLPFGGLPGAMFLGLATTDTFVHGWDLAKATGQATDLDPDLADQLLAAAQGAIPDQFRGPDGQAPFGAVVEPPPGASAADRLAAFLGRQP